MDLFAVVLAATTTTKPTTSTASSVGSLLFIVVLGLAAYVFFIRPRSQAARRQRDTLMELSAGDEVLTGAGIFGKVLDVESDRVTIETAPGTRITVLRSTIARKMTEPFEDEQGTHDEHREGVSWEGRSGEQGEEHHDDDDGGEAGEGH
ncbi:MAG: preprotein translocase subunit YajC [Acidimicrobiales bacterium]